MEELRMECLRLVVAANVAQGADAMVAEADKLFAWVTATSIRQPHQAGAPSLSGH